MKNIFRSNLFSLIIIVLQILGAFIIGAISVAHKFSATQILLFSDLFILLLPINVYFIITKLPVKETLRFNKLGLVDIIITIAIGFLFIPIGSFLSIITSFFFENNVVDVMNQLSVSSNITFFIIIALLPAILEELAVRGIILSGYKNISIHKAAIITGLIFALFHLNPPQFLYTFILGIMLAYVVYYTNSIFSSMIIHFIFNGFNSLVFIYMKNNNSKVLEQTASNASTLTPPLVISSLFLASCCTMSIIIFLRVLRNKNSMNISLSETNSTLCFSDNNNQKNHASSFKSYLPLIISISIFILFSILTH